VDDGRDIFIHEGVGFSQTHQYRTRVTWDGLTSQWSPLSDVAPQSVPPLAPTLLAPFSTVLPSDESVVFRWRHNTADLSTQDQAQISFRLAGGSWTTIGLMGTGNELTRPAFAPGIWEWRAQTKGAATAFGPYSPVQTFTVADPP